MICNSSLHLFNCRCNIAYGVPEISLCPIIIFLQVSCTLVSYKPQRLFLVPRNRIELLSDAYETPVLTIVLSR